MLEKTRQIQISQKKREMAKNKKLELTEKKLEDKKKFEALIDRLSSPIIENKAPEEAQEKMVKIEQSSCVTSEPETFQEFIQNLQKQSKFDKYNLEYDRNISKAEAKVDSKVKYNFGSAPKKHVSKRQSALSIIRKLKMLKLK